MWIFSVGFFTLGLLAVWSFHLEEFSLYGFLAVWIFCSREGFRSVFKHCWIDFFISKIIFSIYGSVGKRPRLHSVQCCFVLCECWLDVELLSFACFWSECSLVFFSAVKLSVKNLCFFVDWVNFFPDSFLQHAQWEPIYERIIDICVYSLSRWR